uniref:Uncharacterized protein n=1 Tax=Coccidioides posadasii RMSCC 3488 TaxID=454284 RepID=A0A0J6FDA9_COCPO|nr:hypothetical protein CPAG_04618 [Coccidioides posadasii RMSCC 3488]
MSEPAAIRDCLPAEVFASLYVTYLPLHPVCSMPEGHMVTCGILTATGGFFRGPGTAPKKDVRQHLAMVPNSPAIWPIRVASGLPADPARSPCAQTTKGYDLRLWVSALWRTSFSGLRRARWHLMYGALDPDSVLK